MGLPITPTVARVAESEGLRLRGGAGSLSTKTERELNQCVKWIEDVVPAWKIKQGPLVKWIPYLDSKKSQKCAVLFREYTK
ncbi:hypothetical protein IscW_ISCW002814 [Ixodes scapularis]|uniref:Uncharacterized protein n=1 Tax=Ixodes scapularis TaxID=6945 RepID=B7PC37_IXOSC|nr:hypothetical protein IscW_ISCW002814 [Ixodes scapularis]|eukprot:XP_002409308.1 hypothetical protein IscW_ISCW002814 [Ixodes scapularis]